MSDAFATRALVEWLVDGARDCVPPQDVLKKLADGLVAAGVPLARAAVFVRTPHPLVAGRRFGWRAGGPVEVSELKYAMVSTSGYSDSPVAYIYEKNVELRRPLGRADCPLDFPILKSMREEGITDYFGTPLRFTFGGEVHVAVWSTEAQGGFADAHIAAIRSVVAPLARVAEVRALTRTAAALLDTYVGHKTGDRVRAGHIQRGDTETIRAAIWLSDMRGFTALTDREPPETVLDTLNRYFDCQVPAIAAHGGEVLKYIGDGLLAIFPVTGTVDAGTACAEALAAAHAARAEVAKIAGLRFGLALHLGDVLYGNIGSGDRLDFTCIGPAVNLAARLEKIA
ncbi:MAG TPA: adenylate/guanylate cyclase domain-containing protein, partial [Stellaceae bacterium]|nr:adenylate/guanylate cyclase domain-containing protein [Stellaceae bacterium]